MNKKVKKKWIRALRSGQYDQVQGALCAEAASDRTGFCCLGVLCNIHAEESKTLYWAEDAGARGRKFVRKNGKVQIIQARELSYLGSQDDLPRSVLNWSGLTKDQEAVLVDMNDGGSSFDKIAEFIEDAT